MRLGGNLNFDASDDEGSDVKDDDKELGSRIKDEEGDSDERLNRDVTVLI